MKNTKSSSKFLSSKTKLILGTVVLLLIVAGVLAWTYKTNHSSKPTAAAENTPGTSKLNLNPATDEEKQDSQQIKEETAKREEQANQPTTGTKKVTPVIVDASQYGSTVEVRSYIPNIFEDGGTCSFAFAKSDGGANLTKQTSATKDATTTRCTNLSVNKNEFSTGAWTVTVSYKSATAEGSSSTATFEVK